MNHHKNLTENTLEIGTLKSLYSTCLKLGNNDYKYIAQKGEEFISVNIHFQKDDIVHYTGLEYLPSIVSIINNEKNGKTRSQRKRTLANLIKKKKFLESNFQDEDIVQLNFPRSPSLVPGTETNYNIYHRINRVFSLEKLLQSSDCASDSYLFKGWDKKSSKIPTDYVLSIPSEYNKAERIYMFGVIDKTNQSKDSIDVNVISAFADSRELTRGKPKPYKIVKEDIRSQGNKIHNVYIDPEYQKLLNQRNDISVNTPANNIKTISVRKDNIIPTVGNGAAVLQAPVSHLIPPPTFLKDLSDKLKGIWNKVKNVAGSLGELPKSSAVQTDKKTSQKHKPTAQSKRSSHSKAVHAPNEQQRNKNNEKSIAEKPKQTTEQTFYISRSTLNKNAQKIKQERTDNQSKRKHKAKNSSIGDD